MSCNKCSALHGRWIWKNTLTMLCSYYHAKQFSELVHELKMKSKQLFPENSVISEKFLMESNLSGNKDDFVPLHMKVVSRYSISLNVPIETFFLFITFLHTWCWFFTTYIKCKDAWTFFCNFIRTRDEVYKNTQRVHENE